MSNMIRVGPLCMKSYLQIKQESYLAPWMTYFTWVILHLCFFVLRCCIQIHVCAFSYYSSSMITNLMFKYRLFLPYWECAIYAYSWETVTRWATMFFIYSKCQYYYLEVMGRICTLVLNLTRLKRWYNE